MLVRNRSKGEKARSEISQTTGSNNLFLEIVDLSRLSDIRDFVERFQHRTDRLDVLINNAGVLLDERQESVDGIELTLATNIVGPFLLTRLLIPLLKQSAPARIIVVSSGGMYARKLNVDDLQFKQEAYSGVMAYAQTKRAQVILTELGAKRLAGSGVTINAMHPGWVKTPGLQTSLPLFSKLTNFSLRTPAQGADTIVWLAVAPHLVAESGKFWFDRRARETHKINRTKSSTAERQQLWAECVRLSGLDEE
jgi:NAD(P)-dependent dehydrogenase (short-subunit alcohol dehydrogenase family)